MKELQQSKNHIYILHVTLKRNCEGSEIASDRLNLYVLLIFKVTFTAVKCYFNWKMMKFHEWKCYVPKYGKGCFLSWRSIHTTVHVGSIGRKEVRRIPKQVL